MWKSVVSMKRRTFLGSATMAAAGFMFARTAAAKGKPDKTSVLFDGKTLDGWIQAENSATSFSGNDITDLSALAKCITTKADGVAAFVNGELDAAVIRAVGSWIERSTKPGWQDGCQGQCWSPVAFKSGSSTFDLDENGRIELATPTRVGAITLTFSSGSRSVFA